MLLMIHRYLYGVVVKRTGSRRLGLASWSCTGVDMIMMMMMVVVFDAGI